MAQCGQMQDMMHARLTHLQLTEIRPPNHDISDSWAFEGPEASVAPGASVFSTSTTASDDEHESCEPKIFGFSGRKNADFRPQIRVKHTFLEIQWEDVSAESLIRPRMRSSSDSMVGSLDMDRSQYPQLVGAIETTTPPAFTNFTETWDPSSALLGSGCHDASFPDEQGFYQFPCLSSESSLESTWSPFHQMSLFCTFPSWADTGLTDLDTPWSKTMDQRMSCNADAVATAQALEIAKIAAPQQMPVHPKNCFDANAPQVADHERTTIMFRNLPKEYSRDMLLELLDTEGFKGSYDFVYMPMDFEKDVSFSYAFVNFVHNEKAESAQSHLQGFTNWVVQSPKICDATWSGPQQGYSAHIDRFRNSPVMHEDMPDQYKPVVFQDGFRAAFPAATKRIRKPRMRHQTSMPSASARNCQ